jgi:hypothetical protein
MLIRRHDDAVEAFLGLARMCLDVEYWPDVDERTSHQRSIRHQRNKAVALHLC